MKTRAQPVIVLPQVTLRDLEAATMGLDRHELLRRMGAPSVEGVLPSWVRVLLEHPLGDKGEWEEWVKPFQWNLRWRATVLMLRVRDWPNESSLAEEDTVGTSTDRLVFQGDEGWAVRAAILARGQPRAISRLRQEVATNQSRVPPTDVIAAPISRIEPVFMELMDVFGAVLQVR
jgi:hypothetical protein